MNVEHLYVAHKKEEKKKKKKIFFFFFSLAYKSFIHSVFISSTFFKFNHSILDWTADS